MELEEFIKSYIESNYVKVQEDNGETDELTSYQVDDLLSDYQQNVIANSIDAFMKENYPTGYTKK